MDSVAQNGHNATVTTQLAIFDYDALDSDARMVVQQRTTEIRALMRRAAQDIIDIGTKLIEVKARLGHGQFGAWLRAEFEWSVPTAARMMQVAERFGDNYQIDNFAPSALYLLAAPSTPEPARLEALERATNGESITHAAAKEIVAAHRSAAPSLPVSESFILDDEQDDEPSDDGAGDAPDIWQPLNRHATDVVEDRAVVEDDDIAFDDPDAFDTVPPEPEPEPAPSRMAVHFSSATPEWYTPAHIITRVLDLFGHIDLDPCSNAKGDDANVPARFHFTREDDGLTQSWRIPGWVDDHGAVSTSVRVYMNPPYGDEIVPWVERLIRAYTTGEIDEAIALLPARTDTQWFQPLFDYPMCFVEGRLKFVGPKTETAPFPSVVVYLGDDLVAFRDAFGSLGTIMRRDV